MPQTPVIYDDVEMLRRTELGAMYRINGRDLFIGLRVTLQGTTALAPGQQGCLVVPRWFAEAEGLPIPGASEYLDR